MVKKKDTITGKELCERYNCCLRTIHAKQKKLGYPDGVLFGKDLVFSFPAVIAWEKKHMPHLHGGEVVTDDSEQWRRMKAGEVEDDPPPPKRRGARRKK